jgi:3-hydroxy acid dehydrogenase / malonic semialdehyde reductase
MKTILITGASSGIGRATAHAFAQNAAPCKLILCGRRADRLSTLAEEISSLQVESHSLLFDVSSWTACQGAIASLPTSFAQIDILINNAGNAHGLGPVQENSVADWQAMIGSNIEGVLHLTRLISPQMVNRKAGQIINIGSVAGRQSYPNGAVYCATKAAIVSFTQALRMDLYQHGIKVTCIDPGMVESEFSNVRFKGDNARADAVYNDLQPLTPADVADSILYAATRPAHVLVADMLLLPLAQAAATQIHRIPTSVLDK